MTFVTTFEELEPYLDRLDVAKRRKHEIKKAIRSLSFPYKFPEEYLKRITDISPLATEIQDIYNYEEGTEDVLLRYKKEVLKIIAPMPMESAKEKINIKDYVKFVGVAGKDKEPVKGIVRVYKKRALFVPYGECAGHCLWCFRNKTEFFLDENDLNNAIAWLKKHKEIYDVILTGGEPLLGSKETFNWILKKLWEIEHIKIIRFHTRILAYLPEKLDEEFFKILKKYNSPEKGKSIWVIAQIVHPIELTGKALNATQNFLYDGVPVLNQAPILRNINDDQRTFNEWHDRMVFHGIKPYYDIGLIITPGYSNKRFYVPAEKIKELQKKYYDDGDGLGIAKIILPIMGKKYSLEELKKLEKEGYLTRLTKSQIYSDYKG